jgi:hypothetical protein
LIKFVHNFFTHIYCVNRTPDAERLLSTKYWILSGLNV